MGLVGVAGWLVAEHGWGGVQRSPRGEGVAGGEEPRRPALGPGVTPSAFNGAGRTSFVARVHTHV